MIVMIDNPTLAVKWETPAISEIAQDVSVQVSWASLEVKLMVKLNENIVKNTIALLRERDENWSGKTFSGSLC